jgi:hypothetical protein
VVISFDLECNTFGWVGVRPRWALTEQIVVLDVMIIATEI